MSYQCGINKDLEEQLKKEIKKEITCYSGDLFKDNEISIKFNEEGEAYIQFN